MLPFVPKSRPGRVVRSGPDCRGTSQISKGVTSQGVQNAFYYRGLVLSCFLTDDVSESSNSLSSLYSKWNNPVFVRPPVVNETHFYFAEIHFSNTKSDFG